MLETLLHKIPSSIDNLRLMQALDIIENELTCPIPSEIIIFKELKRLNLMVNKMKGEIPQGIGELSNRGIWFGKQTVNRIITLVQFC